MEIITIANQKGGVGKTTTASALGAGLLKKGKKVLFIDLDPQMNLTSSLGFNSNTSNIYDVLLGKLKINEVIQIKDKKHMIAGSRNLSSADTEFNLPGREYKLRRAIEKLKNDYDYVIIDTPPALGTLTINALTACDSVIITAEADMSSIQGILQLKETIDAVKEYCNEDLKVSGILITRYSRTILSKDLTGTITTLADSFNTKVYNTPIRECIALKESKVKEQDIFEYDSKSNAASDYLKVINEFLKDTQGE